MASCKGYTSWCFARAQKACPNPPTNQVVAVKLSFGRLCARLADLELAASKLATEGSRSFNNAIAEPLAQEVILCVES